MSDAKKKPMPDIFLLALGKINKHLGDGEREVKAEECLVFEDSVAGVEAGRRAGMRVVWCPHVGLRGLWRGREEVVLEGRSAGVEEGKGVGDGEKGEEEGSGEKRLWSRDGWAEMRMSLEGFDYGHYGIHLE
jgi:pseudouridine-5'-monophosphatase